MGEEKGSGFIFGNLTRKLDRNERVTQYTFDDLDRMTTELWIDSGDPVPTLGVTTTTQGGRRARCSELGSARTFRSPAARSRSPSAAFQSLGNPLTALASAVG